MWPSDWGIYKQIEFKFQTELYKEIIIIIKRFVGECVEERRKYKAIGRLNCGEKIGFRFFLNFLKSKINHARPKPVTCLIICP